MDVEAAKQIFSAGEHLEQAGKLEQAIACYQQATKLHSENYYYHYKLGNILRQQGNSEQATKCFHKAIALNHHDSWSYYALGEICIQQQDIAAAIKYYRQAIAIDPQFSWSHYNLARLYQQQNQLELAKVCYQQAIALKPDYFWSHFFLAEILTTFQEREEAIKHYQDVIKLNPNFAQAHFQLARHLQQKGQLEAAVEHYIRAIELNQDNFQPYYLLGETLVQLSRHVEAICHCEAAIELQPNNLQPYYLLGLILLHQGEQAIADYCKFATQKSVTFQINLELGLAQAWQQQGKTSNSVQCCQQAIKIDPTAEMPYRILQYISLEPPEINDAITFYQQISDSTQVSPLLWGNLGDLYTKQSRLDEAIKCYRKSCYQSTVTNYPQLAKLDWQQPKQNAPDFLLIGATKCGTTSLFNYLSHHPQILAPHKKEINFFNFNYNQGVEWYLAHFPAITDGKEYLTGEASPFYIYHAQAAERIRQLFPDIKIIVMLRNPVNRTISEYYHAANHGLEQRSLTAIIEQEKQLLATQSRSEVLNKFGYLINSIYFDRIVQWQSNFSDKNTLIIDSEMFFAQTEQIMQQIWQLLGLPSVSPPQHIRYNLGTYPPVKQEIKKQLQEFFAPYNQQLFAHLNQELSWQ
ncbi:MAG: tetratricopeptide repeat protein [Cyanobacteria bacterium P01_G01_bin.67]